MGGQLPQAAELDAAILGTLATLAGEGADQLALELGQAARDGSASTGRAVDSLGRRRRCMMRGAI
jgi:hypothetical protein